MGVYYSQQWGGAYSYPLTALQETHQEYSTYSINQGQCEPYQYYFLRAST